MKEKFRFICIPIIILSILTFLLGTVYGGIYEIVPWIIGGVLMFLSLIFTVIAMLKSPFLCIGTAVLGCVSSNIFMVSYYYNGSSMYVSLVANIAMVLSIIYVAYGVCLTVVKNSIEQSKPKAVQQNKTIATSYTTQSKLVDFSQELQEYKYLLDNGILTADEFATQKTKTMKKYGIAVPQKAPVPTPIPTVAKTVDSINGDYDMGTLILTISERTFCFRSKESNIVAIQGTFIFDKITNTLTLFKPDKSILKLSINQDGNLVLPNGMVYKKL